MTLFEAGPGVPSWWKRGIRRRQTDSDALGIHAEETMLKSDLFPPEATKFLALPTETQNPAEITKM